MCRWVISPPVNLWLWRIPREALLSFVSRSKAFSDSRELQVGIVRLFTPSLYETPYLSTRNDPKVGTPALRMGYSPMRDCSLSPCKD